LNSGSRIYYTIRPTIPRRIQLLLRGMAVRKKYPRYKTLWPIHHEVTGKPERWKGWPNGKKFAFILTHDVETKKGYERCLDLIKLEMKQGFTSSYNFVPERYEVSPSLRKEIADKGFEVGVHDLRHDGKLFNNYKTFIKKSARINGYLKEWGAAGFRSAAMHHNLDWINALDIEYDASTFDFDPFEPDPSGMMTIFPFWVNSNGTGNGYVELPYTIPQDFTLFLLLKEKNISIWKKKIDWVASKGGMALVNVHPDYICFNEGKPNFDEYPIGNYKEILEYVKTKYFGQYWNVLPREVARFYKNSNKF